ncbi:hypothetical protein [Pseudohongiella acticola]|uniref:hypothetical protein n=1 Tax=Pseudohongiella acticola TaxID=1524254 RepID=UPI00111307C3|nr:hypothetical protein [Pseudohongiella acticola]
MNWKYHNIALFATHLLSQCKCQLAHLCQIASLKGVFAASWVFLPFLLLFVEQAVYAMEAPPPYEPGTPVEVSYIALGEGQPRHGWANLDPSIDTIGNFVEFLSSLAPQSEFVIDQGSENHADQGADRRTYESDVTSGFGICYYEVVHGGLVRCLATAPDIVFVALILFIWAVVVCFAGMIGAHLGNEIARRAIRSRWVREIEASHRESGEPISQIIKTRYSHPDQSVYLNWYFS